MDELWALGLGWRLFGLLLAGLAFTLLRPRR